MNQFSPMSADITPRPHQRFFGAETQNNATPPTDKSSDGATPDFHVNPLPGGSEDAPPADIQIEEANIQPITINVQEPTMDIPAPNPAPMPVDAKQHDEYYKSTHDHLLRTRKERNEIILKMDKIEDSRIEKGIVEYDEKYNEFAKLQNDLWRKNNLIEALVKVLTSLN